MTDKTQLTEELVRQAIKDSGANSFTSLYRALGHKAKPNGKATATIKALVPEIEELLKANKPEGTPKSEPSSEKKSNKPTPKATGFKSTKFPRHPKNPFREGSGYGLLTDIIASAGTEGIAKPDVLKAYCKATGKDDIHARYDLAVINSASTVSERKHRSCRDGFSILRDGDNLRIKFA